MIGSGVTVLAALIEISSRAARVAPPIRLRSAGKNVLRERSACARRERPNAGASLGEPGEYEPLHASSPQTASMKAVNETGHNLPGPLGKACPDPAPTRHLAAFDRQGDALAGRKSRNATMGRDKGNLLSLTDSVSRTADRDQRSNRPLPNAEQQPTAVRLVY